MITLTAKIVLEDGTEIAIDKRNILSLEADVIDRSDISLPSWGIISNRGSLTFADYDETVRGYADDLRLSDNAKAVVYLTNTITQSIKEIKNYLTSNWDYDSNNRTVSVSLKDDLEEWQDIAVKGFDYDPRDTISKNLRFFYEYLHSKTPYQYNFLVFNDLDSKTQEILESTYIKYHLLKDASLWQQWNKLCIVSQAHIFKNDNGNTVFIYNGGD